MADNSRKEKADDVPRKAKNPLNHSQKANEARPSLSLLSLNTAFYLCAFSHILAAFHAPIQDCDEVFNYWEPLHYLNHGTGFQTWEYSPEFALRSWLYIVIHAIPAKLGYLFSGGSKTFEFYFLRIVLAIFCAATEARLFAAISRSLNARIGIIYLIMAAFSPGVFYASVALLPSSFAMLTANMALAGFIDWRLGPSTASGIMWVGIGAIVGWPFSALLILPFLFEEATLAFVSGEFLDLFRRLLDGLVRSSIVLALQCAIDAFFYHKFVVVPWRLVFYNILAGTDRGPQIFGTEPWHFYARNLLLNFHIWYLLAIFSGPLLLLQFTKPFSLMNTKQTLFRMMIFIFPFYLWMVVLTLQPHKEERFVYPAYPFLLLNAAIALHMILVGIGSTNTKGLIGKIPVPVKFFTSLVVLLAAFNLGLFRIIGTTTGYQAPLEIYQPLKDSPLARPGATVCLGKEWYRFPSSFHLPAGMNAKFVKSEFSGLLPGEFSQANTGFGLFPGTWLPPAGMNDRNQEDSTKHIHISHCTFLVDSRMPSSEATILEPDYIGDEGAWKKIFCRPFLDPSTVSLARILWVPNLGLIPEQHRRRWGEYCLLERK